MIIFFESGQLGNQLFQYCGLRKIFHGESILFVGMDSLRSTFDGIKVDSGTVATKLILRLLSESHVRNLFIKSKIAGYVSESNTVNGCFYDINKGIIRNLVYCYSCYFQSEDNVDDEIAAPMQLKAHLSRHADNLLLGLPAERSGTFFVHIRRRDYASWPPNAPALLPLRWYREQMDRIRAQFRNPFFVVVSDDPPYAEAMFGACADVYVSNGDAGCDFALMTKCAGGGILSASSYSWWAAYFARRANRDAVFVAPLYWAGHRRGEWFPAAMKTSWLNYAVVHDE